MTSYGSTSGRPILTLEPLPGQPDALTQFTGRYETISEQLRSASQVLRLIASDEEMVGRSIAEVRTRVSEASSALIRAEPRYSETSAALSEYAVTLDLAQADARRAIDALGSDAETADALETERERLQTRLYSIQLSQHDQSELQNEIHALDRHLSTLHSSIHSARSAHERAVELRDQAAEAAIRRIHAVLELNADSISDKIRGGWDDLTGGVVAIGDWIWNVALPAFIVAVILVEALSAILNPVTISLLLLGVGGIILAGLLSGSDGDGILNDLIAAASSVLPKLSVGLKLLLLREALTPTPQVTAVTPPGGVTSGSSGPSYRGLFLEDGRLDKQGGADETLIEVVQIIGEDGTSSWRVILPSTQDWQFQTDPSLDLSDRGGLNDLGSNLALMLTPGQEAAYQRAVITAMNNAGIGPNDPVMLAGWSQGGMIAGRLASDPNTPGQVRAIVVGGSPIDSMPIPDGVNMLSIQQPGDLVPKTDGRPAADSTDRWVTVNGSHSGIESHSAVNYGDGAFDDIDSSKDPRIVSIVQSQTNFFGEDERVNIYQAAG